MRIANPIYDVVFKYLLDDEKVARMLLGAVLGREILELEFRPTEVRHEVSDSLLVLRLDFAATLRLEDGSRKLVLMEIQKAHSPLDVMRFRKYLGAQYANGEHVYVDEAGRNRAIPIVTIYFLGEGLEGIEAPVVKVNRHYTDAASGEVLHTSDPFVEALTHDSIVVQINRLKNRRRNDLEKLLMVFDQDQAERSDPHLLDILEENFPERYKEVLRRLMRACAEKAVRDGMDVEDEFLATLQNKDRQVADARETVREMGKALEEKDKVLAEKDQVLAEKDQVLAEKDQVLAEKDQALAEKDDLIEKLRRRLARG